MCMQPVKPPAFLKGGRRYGFSYPRAGGHASGEGVSPLTPRISTRALQTKSRAVGKGADVTGDARHIDVGNWGAHAVVKWGHLVMSPTTAREQLIEKVPDRFTPQWEDTRAHLTLRPALSTPRYRHTAVKSEDIERRERARTQRAFGGRR